MVAGSRCSGPGEHEGEHHDAEHRQRLLQQYLVDDGRPGAHPHDQCAARRCGMHGAAPQHVDHHRLRRHHHDDHGREVDDEGVEVETGERADQDVGRVADQRGGAADIGGEDLREQERIGRHVELAGDCERHRHDQQHRGHIVEERREHGGGELQQQQNAGGIGLGLLRRPDRERLEHAGAARDRHQDHHAGEEPDGVPVDALQRLGLVERADDDHRGCAEQRHDRSVELVPDDDRVGERRGRRSSPPSD